MADFKALFVDKGVGDYHFNRFRIRFEKPAGVTKEACARDFVAQFPHYFNSGYASVEVDGAHSFEGNPVLKFHGFDKMLGLDLAAAHHDWVVQFALNPNVGFTAQTLERTFRLWEDAAMLAEGAAGGAVGGGVAGAGVGAAVGAPFAGVGAGPGALAGAAIGAVGGTFVGGSMAYNANFCHFLAGRRAWRLDDASVFGMPGDYLVLETAAVERFSSTFYKVSDVALGLEDMIPPIWNTLLTNFVGLKRLTAAPGSTPPGWTRGGSGLETVYTVQKFETVEALKKDGEFHRANLLFPELLPPHLR